MISTEKPGTPAELLHYGVKGMKWGVRKSEGTRQFNQKYKTNLQRYAAIQRARTSMSKSRIAIKTATTKAEKKSAKDAFVNNPDYATALRLTRGEKVVFALLTPTGPIGIGIGAGLAVRVGRRRALEK